MADITKINLGGTEYSLVDETSRDLGDKMVKYSAQELTSEQIDQVFTNWGMENMAGLIYDLHTSLYVNFPASWSYDVTVTIVKRSNNEVTMTYVGRDGCHEFILPDSSDYINSDYWDVIISANGHNSRTGSIKTTSSGNSYYITVGWNNTTITVNHPVGTDSSPTIVRASGSRSYTNTVTDGETDQSVFNQITSGGAWTITVRQTCPSLGNNILVHSEKSSIVYVDTALSEVSAVDVGDWEDVLVYFTYPKGATVQLQRANGFISDGTNTSSGNIGISKYYVDSVIPASGTSYKWRFTASHTKHSSLYWPVGSTSSYSTWGDIDKFSVEPYVVTPGELWTDTKVSVSIPGASLSSSTRMYIWSGSGTYTGGGNITSGNYKKYNYVFTQDGAGYAFYPQSAYHTSYASNADDGSYPVALFGATVSGGTFSTTGISLQQAYNDVVLDYKDTYLDVTHPSGATVTINPSSYTTKTSLSTTSTRFIIKRTSSQLNSTGYVVTAAASGHTSKTSNAVNVTSLNQDLSALSFTTTWSDTTITVTVPKDVPVNNATCKRGTTAYAVTRSGNNNVTATVRPNATGNYVFTIVATGHTTKSGSAINVTSLNNTYLNAQTLLWDDVYWTINHPSNVTPTISPSATVKSTTSTQKVYALNQASTSYTVSIVMTGHTTQSATKSSGDLQTVPASNTLSWIDTFWTVNHPSGATCSVTATSGTSYTRTGNTNTTKTYKITGIASGGSILTVTASLTGHSNQSVSSDKITSIANVYASKTITWGDAYWTVTHPSGATMAISPSATQKSSTNTQKVYALATKNTTYTATASATNHSSCTTSRGSGDLQSVPTSSTITWTDVYWTVNHPTDATVAISPSATAKTSTTSKKVYALATANTSYTVTASATNHTSKTATKGSGNLQSSVSDNTLSWSDVYWTVNHPDSSKFPSGTTVSISPSASPASSTTTKKVYKLTGLSTTYTASLTATGVGGNGHSASSGNTSVSVTTGSAYTTAMTAKTLKWVDTTITVTAPSGSTVSCSSKPSGATATQSNTKWLVNKSGSYTFTATKTGYVANSYTVSIPADFNSTPSGTITWKTCTIKVNHPSGATVTCTSKPSGSSATQTTGTTQDSFVVNMTGAYTFKATASNHTSLKFTTTLAASNMGSSVTIGSTSWNDSKVTITYSNGCALMGSVDNNIYYILSSSATSFTYNSHKTYTYVLPELGTWTIMAYIGNAQTYYMAHAGNYTSNGTTYTANVTFDLPYGYLACNYISSNGNGYFDTGMKFQSGTSFEIEYEYVGSSGAIGGTYAPVNSVPESYYGYYGTLWLAFPSYGLNPYYSGPTIYRGQITGTSASSSGTISMSYSSSDTYGTWFNGIGYGAYIPTIYLFAVHQISVYIDPNQVVDNGAQFKSSSRIHSFSGRYLNTLFDYVPAYDVNSGTYGFYDKQSGQFKSGYSLSGEIYHVK